MHLQEKVSAVTDVLQLKNKSYLPDSPSSQELLGDTSGDNVVGETSPKFCKIH